MAKLKLLFLHTLFDWITAKGLCRFSTLLDFLDSLCFLNCILLPSILGFSSIKFDYLSNFLFYFIIIMKIEILLIEIVKRVPY